MQVLLAILIGGVIGASVGVAHTRYLISPERLEVDAFHDLHEHWAFSQTVGSSEMTPLERARIAVGGPLGLQAKETVYFVSNFDSEGGTLSSDCRYRIHGGDFDTRWWSITVYDNASKDYIPGDDGKPLGRVSWNSTAIPKAPDGTWEIWLSRTPEDGAWLPLHREPDKQVELLLRLYNPSESLRAKLPRIEVPTVEKVSC